MGGYLKIEISEDFNENQKKKKTKRNKNNKKTGKLIDGDDLALLQSEHRPEMTRKRRSEMTHGTRGLFV